MLTLKKEWQVDAQDVRDLVWSGAKDRVNDLTDDQIETILSYLEDIYPDGMDETEFNDFLWFDDDTYADWLGYSSADALWRGSNLDVDELYVDVYNEDFDDEGNEITTYAIYNNDGDTYMENSFTKEFDSEEEAQDYLDEHKDEFTEDDF